MRRKQDTRPRVVLALAIVAAVVVFAIVQDRVTAAGARRYVELQNAAIAGQGTPVTLDEVMRPAIRRSVQQGSLWGGMVLAAGAAAAAVLARGM